MRREPVLERRDGSRSPSFADGRTPASPFGPGAKVARAVESWTPVRTALSGDRSCEAVVAANVATKAPTSSASAAQATK